MFYDISIHMNTSDRFREKYITLIPNHSPNVKFKKQSIVNFVSNLELPTAKDKPTGMTFFLHIIKF